MYKTYKDLILIFFNALILSCYLVTLVYMFIATPKNVLIGNLVAIGLFSFIVLFFWIITRIIDRRNNR